MPSGTSSSPEEDEEEAEREKDIEASWVLGFGKLGSVGAGCRGATRRAGEAASACHARADLAGVGLPLDALRSAADCEEVPAVAAAFLTVPEPPAPPPGLPVLVSPARAPAGVERCDDAFR